MSTEQITRIEMEGLCETIIQYSNDNYIISYAKQLRNTSYQEDKDVFLILIDRLYQWYEGEIERIKESEYTLGKYTYTNWLGQTVTKFYSNDEIADIMYDELLDGRMKYILDGVLVYTDE